MFESLGDRLDGVFKKFRGQSRLTEENVGEGLREVRLALLEADVNFGVVKDFVARVRERALGQDVLKSLTPGQQVVKIVNDELTELLGGDTAHFDVEHAHPESPLAIMMVGLQGSGKTTSSGKIALWMRREHAKKPLLVPADVYRPAAIDQLKTLAAQLEMDVFDSDTSMNPVDICTRAMEQARANGNDAVLLDTAGRLAIDEPLMAELANIKAAVRPREILFVADAMTGQDAVNVAKSFDEQLDLSGVVLTKMDGDARGGAALSIKSVTGKPVKFVGMGEKLSELEVFHPDRIAGRILGMGDIVSLAEKAQAEFDEDEAEKMAAKMKKAEFDFEDFQTQMRRMKKLGSMQGLLKMIPGMGQLSKQLGDMDNIEDDLNRVDAVINSMTVAERKDPALLNKSRKERIAQGCGRTVADVNGLVKNFEQMRKTMKKMMGGSGSKASQGMGGMGGGLPGMGGLPGLGGMGGMGGMPGMSGLDGGPGVGKKGATKKRASKRKNKKKKKKR